MPGDEIHEGNGRASAPEQGDAFEAERRSLSDAAVPAAASNESKTPAELAESFNKGLDALNSGKTAESAEVFKQLVVDVRQSLIQAYQHGGLKNLRTTYAAIDKAIEGKGNGIVLTQNGLSLEFDMVRPVDSAVAQERLQAGVEPHKFFQDRGSWYERLASFDLYPHGLRHDADVLKKFEKKYGGVEEKAAEMAGKIKENSASHEGRGVSRWLMEELRGLTVDLNGHSSLQDAINKNLKGSGYSIDLDYKFGIKGMHGETGVETVVELRHQDKAEPVARQRKVYDTVRSWGEKGASEELGIISEAGTAETKAGRRPGAELVEKAEGPPSGNTRQKPADRIEGADTRQRPAAADSEGLIEKAEAPARDSLRPAGPSQSFDELFSRYPEAMEYMRRLHSLSAYTPEIKLELDLMKGLPDLKPLAEATIRSIEYNEAIAAVQGSSNLKDRVKAATLAALEGMREAQIENPFHATDLGKNIFRVEAYIKDRYPQLSPEEVRRGRAEAMTHRMAVEKSVAQYRAASVQERASSAVLLASLAASESGTGRPVVEDTGLLSELKGAAVEQNPSGRGGSKVIVGEAATGVPALELVTGGTADDGKHRQLPNADERAQESSSGKTGRMLARTAAGVVGASVVVLVVYKCLSEEDRKRYGEYVRSKISKQ